MCCVPVLRGAGRCGAPLGSYRGRAALPLLLGAHLFLPRVHREQRRCTAAKGMDRPSVVFHPKGFYLSAWRFAWLGDILVVPPVGLCTFSWSSLTSPVPPCSSPLSFPLFSFLLLFRHTPQTSFRTAQWEGSQTRWTHFFAGTGPRRDHSRMAVPVLAARLVRVPRHVPPEGVGGHPRVAGPHRRGATAPLRRCSQISMGQQWVVGGMCTTSAVACALAIGGVPIFRLRVQSAAALPRPSHTSLFLSLGVGGLSAPRPFAGFSVRFLFRKFVTLGGG